MYFVKLSFIGLSILHTVYIYIAFMVANQFITPTKTSFISISCNPLCKPTSNSAGCLKA